MIGAALRRGPIGESASIATRGVVYTQPWAVDLVLDLAGYDASADLFDAVAIEPAAGIGNFLTAMVARLIDACSRQGRYIGDCTSSLLAYELDPVSAGKARQRVVQVLLGNGISQPEAETLAQSWVRVGDFLLEPTFKHQADFVLGNPPYVRLEHLPSETETIYREQYSTMVGRTNLYIAFYEAALKSLKSAGVCAFICADRWMLNQQGSELRRLVTSSYSVETILEIHRPDAFEVQVSAYPAITIIRRANQGPAVVGTVHEATSIEEVSLVSGTLKAVRDGDSIATFPGASRAVRAERWFQGTMPWVRSTPNRISILRALEEKFEPLVSATTGTRVGIGVATGADDLFVSANSELVENSRLLPLALPSDTVTGMLAWSGHYLVNPWNEQGLVDLSKYPQLRAYLEQHETRLRSRYVARKSPQSWYRTIDRVNHHLTFEGKLYIPDIKDRLNPVLDPGVTYPHHKLYFVQSDCWDLEVLGGLLLSDIAQLFIESYGTRIRGGYLRFQSQYLRRIRVPRPSELLPSHANQLVEAFRTRDRELATRIAMVLYEIDGLPAA
jgi:hypothetical protein